MKNYGLDHGVTVHALISLFFIKSARFGEIADIIDKFTFWAGDEIFHPFMRGGHTVVDILIRGIHENSFVCI